MCSEKNEKSSNGNDDKKETSFEEMFSVQALRKTWKTIRGELRSAYIRDIIDWTDWAVTLEYSLDQLQNEIISGTYTPLPPTRFEVGKEMGAYRNLCSLNIRDALVFRHISDFALEKALPYKVKGAYYARRHSKTPVGKTFSAQGDPYSWFFPLWKNYNQYRTVTLLNQPYKMLAVTDITNYFESIQHDLLLEYLAPLGLPRKAIGLLGKILEVFKPLAGHSPNPRIGIPVDELNCSRELAHIFLFEHDRRICDEFGEDNYVRWMDDQNIGLTSETDARKIVNFITKSLSQQRLTLNSGKTKFLSPEKAAIYFQLEANKLIDEWESEFKEGKQKVSVSLKRKFLGIMNKILTSETAGDGNWDKILKRFYGIATRLDINLLERNSLDNLINYPDLSERIFMYFGKRNRGPQLIELFEKYCNSGENLFELTEAQFFESLLYLNQNDPLVPKLIDIALNFAQGKYDGQTNKPLGRAAAILNLYWFEGSVEKLLNLFDNEAARKLPKEVARAWMVCVLALNSQKFKDVTKILFGHPSDDVARLSRFIWDLHTGSIDIDSLGNFKGTRQRWPLPGYFYDARAWLILELASHCKNKELRNALKILLKTYKKYIYSKYEQNIFNRIEKNLNT